MELLIDELKKVALEIKKALEKSKEATIIVHHNADPDAIGSAVALARGIAQLGVKSTVFAPKDISRQSMAVLEKYPYPVERSAKIGSLAFIIDSSSLEQVPAAIPEKCTVILLDHHEPGELAKRADISLIRPESHSTAALVQPLLLELSIELTREIRFFLLTGIVADTGFLRYASREDLKTVLELSEDIGLESVFSSLTVPEELSERLAKLQAAKRLELYRFGDFVAAFSSIGSFESQSALGIIKNGADIAVVFNIQKNEIRISGRMRHGLPGGIDLAEAFAKIGKIIDGGAGGHRTAASANGRDTKSMDAAKHALISYLEEKFRNKAKKIV